MQLSDFKGLEAILVLLVLGGFVLVLGQVLRLVARWRVGASRRAVAGGVLSFPRRYLRDVHHIVARDRAAARMHATLAGSVVALVPVMGLAVLFPLELGRLVLAALLGLQIYGLWQHWQRRHGKRSPHLSAGAWDRMFWWLAGLVALPLALLVPVPMGYLLAGIGAIGAAGLALSVQSGPMRHAVAGALHLINHPRPLRFSAPQPAGQNDTALALADLEAPRLGAEVIGDFDWPRLASFDACVQCGRCEAACPANAAGLPLNPKAFIADLSLALAPEGAANPYAGHPHPGCTPPSASPGPHAPLVIEAGLAVLAPETIWSCTTCRACVEECPMMIEHVDAIVDLRRNLVMEQGSLQPNAAEALENLRLTETVSANPLEARLDGLVDLKLLIADDQPFELLLWLGESAFDRRNQRQIRAFVALLRRAGVDFRVLATERDCGDLARRLGDEATFQALARQNIAALAAHSFKGIVTMDPHVFHCLSREYPALGGKWSVSHYSTLLADLMAEGRLKARSDAQVTYHDPCYLGRYNGGYEAPRALLAAMGAPLTEMAHHKRKSRCCGGGGGAPLMAIDAPRRIPDMRMDEARATPAEVMVVACPFCTQMFEGVTGTARPEVMDLAEFVLANLEEAA